MEDVPLAKVRMSKMCYRSLKRPFYKQAWFHSCEKALKTVGAPDDSIIPIGNIGEASPVSLYSIVVKDDPPKSLLNKWCYWFDGYPHVFLGDINRILVEGKIQPEERKITKEGIPKSTTYWASRGEAKAQRMIYIRIKDYEQIEAQLPDKKFKIDRSWPLLKNAKCVYVVSTLYAAGVLKILTSKWQTGNLEVFGPHHPFAVQFTEFGIDKDGYLIPKPGSNKVDRRARTFRMPPKLSPFVFDLAQGGFQVPIGAAQPNDNGDIPPNVVEFDEEAEMFADEGAMSDHDDLDSVESERNIEVCSWQLAQDDMCSSYKCLHVSRLREILADNYAAPSNCIHHNQS